MLPKLFIEWQPHEFDVSLYKDKQETLDGINHLKKLNKDLEESPQYQDPTTRPVCIKIIQRNCANIDLLYNHYDALGAKRGYNNSELD